jgi:CRP/FNR family transcriptional regulator
MSAVAAKASGDVRLVAAGVSAAVPSRAEVCRSLQGNQFFRLLPDAALLEVAATARCRTCAHGELITAASTAFSDFFVILRGGVRFYLLSRDGRKITLNLLHEGCVFWYGPSDLFALPGDAAGASHCAEALDGDTVLCSMPQSAVRRLMAEHPAFALALFDQVCRWTLEFCDRVWEMAHDQVTIRLAHTLARLAQASATQVVIETHDELAWWVGTSRERVTKELHRLRALGLIEYRPHRRGIRVPDPARLSAL